MKFSKHERERVYMSRLADEISGIARDLRKLSSNPGYWKGGRIIDELNEIIGRLNSLSIDIEVLKGNLKRGD